ncbi:histidine phosphatase family protein [Aliikangiella sp. G2MR2-5]|uniref:histidine phosphatase family protein n=1 Tax=Aliikangiella sp. G2MR2-5 TaxID=2788943 RepID=UPI0018A8C758|nr:histidine phosphatase family protein [Aliikangiella sp. G2MR2-5]
MSLITRFFVARHGETEWNQYKRLQGRLDSPLTVAGQSQARNIARQLADSRIELIVSSTLGRAVHTAKICQQELAQQWIQDEQLVERDFGDWQSSFFDDLADQVLFESVFFRVTEDSPPNGESGIDCGARIENALQRLAVTNVEKRILVVTHGDAIRCLMDRLHAQGQCDAYSQYGNGRIFYLQFCHHQQVLKLVDTE